jgi:hypothetical protein
MADEVAITDTPTDPPVGSDAGKATEETVPFERFTQVNRKAKEAADRAKAAEQKAADLLRELEARENAGLPELEQARKRAEAAEKRAEENERKAAEADARVANLTKASWVTAAAREQGFTDPSDAAAFLDLSVIDDEKDAERAVKRLTQSKPHLIKPDGPRLPGTVLEGGRPPAPGQPVPVASPTEAADRAWAEEFAPQLKKMITYDGSTSA